MSASLKHRAYRGALWSGVDALGARVVQFVIGVVLARLLMPEQFGLIGMLAVFMGVADCFLTCGFGTALIQKKEVTSADTNSVFYFNLVAGVLLAVLLCLIAPWIAAFYAQPILVPLTRAMSLMIVFNSFGLVQSAMLIRRIDFKTQSVVSLLALTVSGAIGIGMAYHGFGVWSLVFQQLARGFLGSLLLWLLCRWRPALVFRLESLRHMFTFGSRLLLTGLGATVFENVYYVVIAKLYSPADLGFYTRARRLQELPSMTLSQVITRVTFPVFSSVQDDTVRLRNGLHQALGTLVFISAPVMIGLAAAAEPLIRVLLTDKWLPCVPYLQIMCIAGLFLPFSSINANVIMAKGRSGLYLRLEMVKRTLVLVNIVIAWPWGITALIAGQAAASILGCWLTSFCTGRLMGYGVIEQLRDVAAYLAFAAAMGAGVYALRYLPFSSDLLLLITQVVSGGSLYLLLCGLFRLPAFMEARQIIGDRIPFLKRRQA